MVKRETVKKIKNNYIILVLVFVLLLSGCDVLDSLNTFPLNIPISIELSVAGNYTSITKSGDICLDESDTYKKYEKKIKDITFLEAAMRTISASPQNLKGHVYLTLADGSGNILFNKDFGVIKPSDYISSPYILPLNQKEIESINTYLNTSGSKCFTAAVTVNDMPGGVSQSIDISIDMVFLSETEF
jgi:hypothetical protein